MKKEEFKLIATPSLMEPQSITFQNNGESTPIIELKANGDIYVKGNLIENDKEVVDAMREFLNKLGLYTKQK
jgi:hypothetical protein